MSLTRNYANWWITVRHNFDLLHRARHCSDKFSQHRPENRLVHHKDSHFSALNYLNIAWNDRASFQDQFWCRGVRSYRRKLCRWLIAGSLRIGRLKKRRQKTMMMMRVIFVRCENFFYFASRLCKRNWWGENAMCEQGRFKKMFYYISLKWALSPLSISLSFTIWVYWRLGTELEAALADQQFDTPKSGRLATKKLSNIAQCPGRRVVSYSLSMNGEKPEKFRKKLKTIDRANSLRLEKFSLLQTWKLFMSLPWIIKVYL